MDASNSAATTVDEYMNATASWRTDLYASRGTLLSHAESIALFKDLKVKMTPELKSASVPMPFQGDYSQAMYAQQMIDEYKAAGVNAADVWAQSFDLEDIKYWIANEPQFGAQAVYLDDRYELGEGSSDLLVDPNNPATWSPSMEQLAADNVKIIAPPMWMLVTLDGNKNIVPSEYAIAAKAAGLDIIAWSFERAGPLANGGGWYYQSIKDAINNDGDRYELLNVLAKDVGIIGMFSDWPATVTYYANCMKL
jgi:glycerophosphoryl diester phosphodiesterase